jgi:glucokinase
MDPQVALALDIGGTKLAAAAVDARGRIRGRAQVPTLRTTDGDELFEALLACAAAALRNADVAVDELAGVGCGCGGPMRWPAGRVSPLNIPAWRDYPLRDRLAAELDRPVLVHNDAVALAAGEHWRGAGAGSTDMLAVTVSTGVGGGLVLAGRLHHGASGNGGHVGHIVVEPDGPACACGGYGCVEAIASGPNTVRRALDEGWRPGDQGPGAEPDGRALAAAAAAGDELAVRNLARAGRAVGLAIASTAQLMDLQVATVAGGFSQSGPAFWDGLMDAHRRHAGLEWAARLRIEPSAIPRDAGLLGAAAFVLLPERYGWAIVG